MTPRARKALLSLMIPLAFAPVVAGADDDVPALLQFAERYQRRTRRQPRPWLPHPGKPKAGVPAGSNS